MRENGPPDADVEEARARSVGNCPIQIDRERAQDGVGRILYDRQRSLNSHPTPSHLQLTETMAFFNRLLQASSATVPRQCLTASVLFGTGDAIAQVAVEKKGLKDYDFIRTARLGLYGGALFAPIMSVWFRTLERVPGRPGSIPNVLGKVALDQGLAAPNMLALFFSATTLMAGGSTTDVKKKLEDSYWSTLKTSWALWIPVQGINMALVPVQQRLLFVNVVSIACESGEAKEIAQ